VVEVLEEHQPVETPDGPSGRPSVHVRAADPVTHEGIVAQLLRATSVRIVPEADLEPTTVVVAAFDALDTVVARDLARLRRLSRCRILLLTRHIDDALLLRATELGISGIVRREDATADMLAGAVRSVATGDGSLPPDLIGRLLGVMERVHQRVLVPNGLTAHGLTEREISVLRLVADGHDTAEIARQLAYSERTIKDILHQLTSRLQLRNRSHAVAFAMRAGVL
jgi:DNA-binding NarL/FixJ family response regulator